MSTPERLTEVEPIERACGNCGYPLVGLGIEGKCPECGEAYAEDEIVLRGWGWGKRQTIRNAPPERVALLVGLVLAGTSAYVFFVTASSRYFLGTVVAVAVACGIQLVRRWRSTSEFGVTCHARLAPRGFGQRDGFGPVELAPWLNIGDYGVIYAGGRRCQLRIATLVPEGDRVSIEFECGEAQAVWLSETIVRLRREDDVRRITS